MGPKKFNYLLPAAAALLLLAAVSTEAHGDARLPPSSINQFCRTATYKRLCNRMVGNAANMHDATANAVKYTLNMARRMSGMMSLVKGSITDLEPVSQESIVSTCTENFERIVDDLETGLKALEAHEVGSLLTRLSAATHNDCQDGMKEFGVTIPVFSKFAARLMHQVDNCLAVIQQI